MCVTAAIHEMAINPVLCWCSTAGMALPAVRPRTLPMGVRLPIGTARHSRCRRVRVQRDRWQRHAGRSARELVRGSDVDGAGAHRCWWLQGANVRGRGFHTHCCHAGSGASGFVRMHRKACAIRAHADRHGDASGTMLSIVSAGQCTRVSSGGRTGRTKPQGSAASACRIEATCDGVEQHTAGRQDKVT